MCRELIDEIATARDRAIDLRADGVVRGRWDPNRLAQAISNLIGNAAQHGTAGTLVTVTLAGDAAAATVEVHNHGTIPADRLSTVFVLRLPR